MEKIDLSSGSVSLSRVAYGCWRLFEDPEGASPGRILQKIDACLQAGISTFDHADIYGGYQCEAAFGAALKQRPALRDDLELVTKCGIKLVDPARPEHRIKHYDTTPAHINASVERSLQNLSTDRIDLLLIHRPDPLMNAAETAGALDALVDAGKIRAYGVSNFTPSQFDMLQRFARRPLAVNQIEVNLLQLNAFFDGTFDHLQARSAPAMIWSPGAGGALFNGDELRAIRVRRTLTSLSNKYAAPIDAIAYAWLLAIPVRPILTLGTNQIDRIKAASRCCSLRLDVQDWFELWSASTGVEVP